jgi:hypothetical protein
MSQPADLAEAVQHAMRAPSVHNTQPWLWRIGPGVVELHADWTRHLAATDPDRRDLLLSCGAALHHLRVCPTRRISVTWPRSRSNRAPAMWRTPPWRRVSIAGGPIGAR